MPAILTEAYRLTQANLFFDSFASDNYYLFVGRSLPFTPSTGGGDDSNPPNPVDDVASHYSIYDEILAAKKINSSDVAYVIPRIDWNAQSMYATYEHDISSSNPTSVGNASNLYEAPFYFITSANRVYKVLGNNNNSSFDAGSGQPTSTAQEPFFHGGYYLKYLYTLQNTTFNTADYVQVINEAATMTAAVDGAIDSILTTAGSGYADGTFYARVDGDGIGAIIRIVVDSGEIQPFGGSAGDSGLEVRGSGYTFASINFANLFSSYDSMSGALSNPASINPVLISGMGGDVKPIIAPPGGHGANAIAELGGHFVLTTVSLSQTENDFFPVGNDFRTYGILKNPMDNSGSVATQSLLRGTRAVFTTVDASNFQVDEEITGSNGFSGVITAINATENIIFYHQNRYLEANEVVLVSTDIITGQLSAATSAINTSRSSPVTLASGAIISPTNGIANADIQENSGEILYVDNRLPVSRLANQTETIKTIIEF